MNFETLIEWHQKNGRHDLPWRDSYTSPYAVWVSEIMLQQTQVNRVKDYFIRHMTAFPTLEDLAHTTWEEYLPYYQGLGYYRRGENMIKTAKIILSEFKGVFPRDYETLRTLPGIGDYTAKAILSFGFEEDIWALDTNLLKVFNRVQHGSKYTKLPNNEIPILPKNQGKTLNSALMDLSSLICTNQNPDCHHCPLASECQYAQTQGTLEIKPKKEIIFFPKKDAQALIILHQNHKVYYSTDDATYKPFLLPPTINSRADIKKYFLKKYKLNVSVRPPHLYFFLEGVPTALINAQILTGKHTFCEYSSASFKDSLILKTESSS